MAGLHNIAETATPFGASGHDEQVAEAFAEKEKGHSSGESNILARFFDEDKVANNG